MDQEINPNPSTRSSCMLEKKSTRAAPKEQLNCPRCKSNNTKFCYYNNYSLTQPRYFCKSCRRYWTEGGSLRSVPVGGGSRKNRKSTTTIMSSSSSSTSSDHFNNPKLPNYPSSQFSIQNPVGRDLNLTFPSSMSHFVEVPIPKVAENVNNNDNNNCGIGFRGLSSFIPNLMPNSNNNNDNLGINNSQYPTGFSSPLDEFKPSLGINNSVDHGFGDGRNLLAFQELNQHSSAAPNESDHHQNEMQQGNNISTGYWSGMLGGGSL